MDRGGLLSVFACLQGEEEGMGDDAKKNRFPVCVDCGEELVFTTSAQEYFEEKGYNQLPKRCRVCHSKYKRERKVAR